jgi:hypothetical protein
MPVKLRAKPHPAKGRNRSLARARAPARRTASQKERGTAKTPCREWKPRETEIRDS